MARTAGGAASSCGLARRDRRDGTQSASFRLVTSQFFSALRIPLRRGRVIGDDDTRDRPLVAVVIESFAQRHWPNDDAIGRTFQTRGPVRTVVGVVGDIKVRAARIEPISALRAD